MPIYTNVLVAAGDGTLTLTGSDLETALVVALDLVAVEEPGLAVLPPQRLEEILREAPAGPVELTAGAGKVRVVTASAAYDMPAEDPAAYAAPPAFPDDGQTAYELAAGDLLRMLRRSAFCAAREEGRYAMRGVLFDLGEDRGTLVATDGKRLAVATGACRRVGEAPPADLNRSHLVPPRAVTALQGLLADADPAGPARVCLRLNDALFRVGRAVVHTRLVEGRFPPWREVVPKKFNFRIPLAVRAFDSAVRQAALMADEERQRLGLHFAPGRLTLEADGATTGKSRVTAPLDYDGPEARVAFIPEYVRGFLRALAGVEAVTLKMVDPRKAAVFELPDPAGDLFLCVPLDDR